ncbi:MAG: M3 family metallopeptidase [Rudaea sp.]|uniref:M3 family metallopeptidase n=1 Tax=unclassified Rudaea TaxID=2627037 RepID=UPI0010F8081B|nr:MULTISPECIES: M3 family metallopeptidase [unclassified Rudaea]MBN8885297.1 M3 family metallopeptidase [Rudaea sp.]MBR0345702.1 M3 family metallopeptidase [Rudaea sp.]
MTQTNPLLADTALPAFAAIKPEHVGPAVDAVLADYQKQIDALTAESASRTFANTMLPQEALEVRLERAWSPVSHLHAVADSPALREAYSAALEKITDFASELGQNRELYAAVKVVAERADFAELPRPARTLVEHALRDFRMSGVALEEPARSRFKEIANQLSKLSNEFENAVLDATEAWSEKIGEAQLAGLPEAERALLKQYAEEAEQDGWLVTLKQPSVTAVLTYADDRGLRERTYAAYQTRASDEGPAAGKFDNSRRIEEIMALRHEGAQLIGFKNAAEDSLATKMAGTPERVLAFLRDLASRAKPVAQRELAELRDFARDELGIADLQPWDVAYAAEKLRVKKYALSEEELKPYFPAAAAIDGLFAIVERVFGVRFAARDGVEVWHPDVRYYDVLDANGKVIAGAYFDLYARSGKRGGAWMDTCRSRYKDGSETHPPIAYLTCNFAPPTKDTPSLLTHDDVVTLFHETGHGLHHMLTEVDLPSVAGIDGVEWDAVELPSQFMENFAWQREALALFARHWKTGEALPEALFQRMLAARHYHAGLFLVRQLEFGLFDFRLHLEFDPTRGARVMELLREVREEVAVILPPAWQRMPHAFGHIFAGGYAAGYYSYLWAELLSADAFSRFEEAGLFDRAAGDAFRRSVFAVGGSRPALESFVEFRGREPEPDALLRSYGLAA